MQDPDHRFELALDLRNLEVATKILGDYTQGGSEDEDSTETMNKWRRLGDLALSSGDVKMAQGCAERSGDLSGLLLLHAATADKQGMQALALRAHESGRTNVAFLAYVTRIG